MGDKVDRDGLHEELPGQATPVAPAAGVVAPPTTGLGALSEADLASGLHPSPDALLVNATPPVAPVFGFLTPGAGVLPNASVLSGAGLNTGPTGPGVGAANADGVAGTGAAPAGGAASAATGPGPAAGTGGTQGANGDVTMSEQSFAAIIAQAIDRVLSKHLSGVSPASRPVPDVFASPGISADEYEHLSTYMKAVKMTPPDKWADENGRDVGFFLTELKSFNVLTGLHVCTCLGKCVSHGTRRLSICRLSLARLQLTGSSVDWEDFEVFMRRSFANMLPALHIILVVVCC